MVRNRRAFLLFCGFLLVMVGCSATPTVVPTAGLSTESASAPFEPEPTLAPVDSSGPADLLLSTHNDGAVFDAFIMNEFGDMDEDRLGAIQLVVSTHCLGLLDSESINSLTRDADLQNRVFAIDTTTCDDVYRASFAVDAPMPDAATWSQAVAGRFERVLWWYGPDEFESAAARYCETRPSVARPSDDDLDLSVSAQIELFGMLQHGDCELPSEPRGNGTSGPGSTLYYLGGESFEEQIHALHLDSGNTVQVTSAPGSGQRLGSGQVVPSPNGELLAYTIKDDPTVSLIGIGASVGGGEIVATRAHHGLIAWSGDGTSLLYRDDRAIVRFDVATSETTTLVEATEGARMRLLGATSNWLAIVECLETCVAKLIDPSGSQQLAAIDVISTIGESVTLSPDGDHLFVINGTTQELQVITITGLQMSEVGRVFAGGSSPAPQVSPDGAWTSFDSWGGAPIRIVDTTTLGDAVGLFEESEGYVSLSVWTPDSQGLVASQDMQEGAGAKIMLISLDGTVTDLGVLGNPIAVVPGDPEGLAGDPEA